MSQRPNVLFADEEEASQKLKRKSKESPFMVAGELSGDFEENFNLIVKVLVDCFNHTQKP